MVNHSSEFGTIRLRLLRQFEKLSLVPDVLERASEKDSSLTPTQLHGAASITEQVIDELKTLAALFDPVTGILQAVEFPQFRRHS